MCNLGSKYLSTLLLSTNPSEGYRKCLYVKVMLFLAVRKGRSHILGVLCQHPTVHEKQHSCKQGELSAGAEQGVFLFTTERVCSWRRIAARGIY